MTKQGKFIALEGIDGCGKSTQVQLLAEWLPQSGLMPPGSSLVATREPGGTQLGHALREILLKSTDNNEPAPIAELLLFMVDRAQHVAKVIKPALNRGDWVLCDRYHGSTVAYQGYGRKHDPSDIFHLHEIATQNLYPDITLWIDIKIETSIQRCKNKSKDRFEKEKQDFLGRVISGYSSENDHYAVSWTRIKGEQSIEDVFKNCKSAIDFYFGFWQSPPSS